MTATLIDGARKEVHIRNPILPQGVESLTVRGLPVHDVSVDLQFQHIGEKVVVAPARHQAGGVRVLAHL